MTTEKQQQQAKKQQRQKEGKFPRRLLLATTIISVALAITVIWILNSQGIIHGFLAPDLSIVISVSGIVIALFQWLLPVSTTQTQTTPLLFEPEPKPDRATDAVSLLTQPDTIFCFNVKLPRPDEFYGRESESLTLINRTSKNASTSIIGDHRIGKTWLIEYLMLGASTKLGSRFRVGYLNAQLPGCATVIGFTTKAAKALGVILTPDESNSGLNALEKVVENFKSRKQIPVLCIDEFERFGNKREFELEFFYSLRALAQDGLILVVASKRPLINIIGDYGNSSGLFNIFEQLAIEPFDFKEAEQFVHAKSDQAGFNERERSLLLQYGQIDNQQWHPLRLQLVGKMLLVDKISGRYSPNNNEYWQKFENRLEKTYRGVIP